MTLVEAPLTTAAIRAAVEQADPHLLLVDYFQLVSTGPAGGDRRAMHDAVLAELKELTIRRNLAGIVISSLSRGANSKGRSEYDPNRDMASFKETGGVEYSGDALFLLESADGKDLPEGNTINLKLRGIASRHDMPKSAYLTFFRPFQRFEQAQVDEGQHANG